MQSLLLFYSFMGDVAAVEQCSNGKFGAAANYIWRPLNVRSEPEAYLGSTFRPSPCILQYSLIFIRSGY